MQTQPTQQEMLEHLRQIINGARSGMFVTHTLEGLHGRPMATAEISESMSALWFAASRTSAKIDELTHDPRIFLSYQKSNTEWATVNGRALAIDDRTKIHELWSPFWKTWFQGPDDPDLILVQVTPEQAEYWDSGNKVVAMVKFAMGMVTGKDMSRDDHQKIAL